MLLIFYNLLSQSLVFSCCFKTLAFHKLV